MHCFCNSFSFVLWVKIIDWKLKLCPKWQQAFSSHFSKVNDRCQTALTCLMSKPKLCQEQNFILTPYMSKPIILVNFCFAAKNLEYNLSDLNFWLDLIKSKFDSKIWICNVLAKSKIRIFHVLARDFHLCTDHWSMDFQLCTDQGSVHKWKSSTWKNCSSLLSLTIYNLFPYTLIWTYKCHRLYMLETSRLLNFFVDTWPFCMALISNCH